MVYFILLFLCFVFSLLYAYSGRKRLYMAFFLILTYWVTYGLRDGWAIDYFIYQKLFLFGGKGNITLDNYEPLFGFFIYLIKWIHDDYNTFLFIVSFLIIFTPIYVLRDKMQYCKYSIPIFIGITAYQGANLIRYFIAISFIYIAIDFLLNNKWKYFLLFCLVGTGIHLGTIILIPFILLIYRYEKIFSSVRLTILLYIITFFIGSISHYSESILGGTFRILSSLDLGNLQLAKYQDETIIKEYILGDNNSSVRSVVNLLCNFLFSISYIILGHKSLKNVSDKYYCQFQFYYKLGILGLLLMNISMGTEILTRIAQFFYFGIYIMAGYIISNTYSHKNKVLFIIYIVSLLYLSLFPIKGLYEKFDLNYIYN